MLDPVAVERLLRVREYILQEPRRLAMHEWLATDVRKKELGDLGAHGMPHAGVPPCGTVGCIAGNGIALFPDDDPGALMAGFSERGRQVLHLTFRQGWELFRPNYWPGVLSGRLYDLASGTPAYAALVAEAIETFIAHDGEWPEEEGDA